MRRSLQSLVFMLALCVPSYAGIMQCPIVEPTPEPATAVQEPSTDGDMQNDAADGDMDNGAAATFLQVVLNLLALP